MVFAPFRSENGYSFCPFWSGIEYGFQENYGMSSKRNLLFQFQMSDKERKICDFEIDFKKSFCWRSYPSNDDIISAYSRSQNGCGFWIPGMKTGVENDIFWSEIGSGFGDPGGTPPSRIPRSTPRGIHINGN